MTITPASASRWLTANASIGVGLRAGSMSARPPAAVTTAAVSRAKSSEPYRASHPITTVKLSPTVSRRNAVSPAAARITTARFIRLGPPPNSPRRPAVPNCSMPENRSAKSSSARADSSPGSCVASTRSVSCFRVSGSGSSAIHSRTASKSTLMIPSLQDSTNNVGQQLRDPGAGLLPSL